MQSLQLTSGDHHVMRLRMIDRRESGASAVEYAIMLVGIAALLTAIVLLLGRQTTASFCNQSDEMAQTDRFGDSDSSAECTHLR